VYRAHHPRLGGDVAIKLLPPSQLSFQHQAGESVHGATMIRGCRNREALRVIL
jgi:hypothetical protein